jgi:hypothetical protein
VRVAHYRNEQDSAPVSADLDWLALVALLTRHTRTACDPCPSHATPKRDCRAKFGPAWSPVEFAPCPPVCRNHGRTSGRDCGGGQEHRLNANVVRIHAAVFDVDVATAETLREIAGKIDAAGLAAVVHSSHSHKPDAYKFRLVFPVSRPIAAAEWPHLRAVVEAKFGIPADRSTKDLARLYFLPSAPASAEVIALDTDGAPLDVDALMREAGPVAPARAASPLAVRVAAPLAPSEPVDLAVLRKRLRELHKDESREIARRILAGEALDVERYGGRDHSLNKAAATLATALPENTPAAAILEIMRPTVAALEVEPEGLDHWLGETLDMIERSQERRRINDAQKREWDRQVRERLMSESAAADDDAPIVVPTPREHNPNAQDNVEGEADGEPAPAPSAEPSIVDLTPASGGYALDQLGQWAEEQGTTIDGFDRRWVIQRGKSFYVFVGGRYKAPITRDDLAVSLPRDLARAPVQLKVEDKDGNARDVGVDQILKTHATVARSVQASLVLQRSFYDARSETFHEAVCPLRKLTPQEHPEIDQWLRLLGGNQAERLLDWTASVMRLDRQSCAIYFAETPGAGKGLFANGLARLWTTGGPSELKYVLEGFNDVLINCPLAFADEALPSRKGITAELRRLIGSTSRNLNRKFMPVCNLDGAVRLVIAGNNDRLLDTGEDLSTNDLEAVAGRFLYIEARPDAAAYLRDLGGPPVVSKWISHDMLAEHALWLRETRSINESSRFLVEGISTEFHDNLATNSGMAGSVCEWLARYLVDPKTAQMNAADPSGRSHLVLAGHGEVWVNADAMVKASDWEARVPSRKVPSASLIGRALRNLSTGAERVKIGDRQHKYHKVKARLLLTWAERSTVVDAEALRARIEGNNETLAKAMRARALGA